MLDESYSRIFVLKLRCDFVCVIGAAVIYNDYFNVSEMLMRDAVYAIREISLLLNAGMTMDSCGIRSLC